LRLANQYIIPFKGLAEGDHEFEFDLEKAFFDEHEVLEAKGGLIKVTVQLIKEAQMLSLKIRMKGFMEITCDRCLEYFNYQINLNNKLVIKFSEDNDESDEEIWYLNSHEHDINLEQYFFDSIAISLPLRKLHPVNPIDGSDGCNKDMLKILNKHVFSDKENESDPRWDKLKNLLNDYNNN
jgi:uncharacterized metal-binding protein YceD (DUF177 family)